MWLCAAELVTQWSLQRLDTLSVISPERRWGEFDSGQFSENQTVEQQVQFSAAQVPDVCSQTCRIIFRQAASISSAMWFSTIISYCVRN